MKHRPSPPSPPAPTLPRLLPSSPPPLPSLALLSLPLLLLLLLLVPPSPCSAEEKERERICLPRLTPEVLSLHCNEPSARVWSTCSARTPTAPQCHPPLFSSFVDYLTEHGTEQLSPSSPKVRIVSPSGDSEEKGLEAAADIQRHEVAATIHFSAALQLTADDVEPFLGASWTASLAAKLLREYSKGAAGASWPYISCLPQWVPIPWLVLRKDEFEQVQYGPAMDHMLEALDHAKTLFGHCHKWSIANASWPQFAWALTMVYTHAYSLPYLDGSHNLRRMFLPVGDLLNHDFEANIDWYKMGVWEDRLDLIALRNISAGEVLLADYGQHNSEHFFLYYGFMPPSNPHDSTIIFATLHEAIIWYLERYHPDGADKGGGLGEDVVEEYLEVGKEGAEIELARLGEDEGHLGEEGDEEADALHIFADGKADPRLLGAFAAVQRWMEGVDWEDVEEEWEIDIRNAYVAVRRKCQEMLSAFPTTVVEDRALLWHNVRCLESEREENDGMGSVVGFLKEGSERKCSGVYEEQVYTSSESPSAKLFLSPSSFLSCDPVFRDCPMGRKLMEARRLVVKFRIAKKEMLHLFLDMYPSRMYLRKRVRPYAETK